MSNLVEMPARTFKAKIFRSPFHLESFELAGTLDGFIDMAVPQGGTYPLSIYEAKFLIRALTDAIADVEDKCLHERDSLLRERGEGGMSEIHRVIIIVMGISFGFGVLAGMAITYCGGRKGAHRE